jgi:hypothetical protein
MPNQSQKPVDIGGQAVLEGVMMKGPDAIAITVRRPDKTMVVDYKKSEPLSKKHKWMAAHHPRRGQHGQHARDGHDDAGNVREDARHGRGRADEI